MKTFSTSKAWFNRSWVRPRTIAKALPRSRKNASRSSRGADPHDRGGDAFDHHVDAGGFAACHRALDRSGQIGDVFDQFAMAADRGYNAVITSGIEFATKCAVWAVVANLQVVLGVPAAIRADDGDERHVASHRRFKIRHVETEGAIAEHREHGGFAFDGPGCAGHRERGTDRPRHAVDHPPVVAQNRLTPLREFPTIADQDGIRVL